MIAAADPGALTILQATLLVAVAGCGTAVAATRDPVRQALVTGVFGVLLAGLFLSVQAPDVALSQITVGAVALPTMILLAVARTRARAARDDGQEPKA